MRYGREYRGGFRSRRPWWAAREGGYGPEYSNETRPYRQTPEADFGGERYDLEYSGRGWPFGVGYEHGERPDMRGGYGRAFRQPRGRGGYGADYAQGRAFFRSPRYDREFRGEPGYERIDRGREDEPGHTPSDRWPDRAAAASTRRMSDGDLRDAVRVSLFEDSWIEPQRIEVGVEDGVVTLRGEVRDYMEARYAWDDAWDTPGVRGVVNQLTVRTDTAEPELPQTAGEETGRKSKKK